MHRTPTAEVAGAAEGAPAGNTGASGLAPIGNAQPHAMMTAPDHAATVDHQQALQPASFATRWLTAIKIDPGSIVTWGATLVVLGLMVASLIGQGVWRVFVSSLMTLWPLRPGLRWWEQQLQIDVDMVYEDERDRLRKEGYEFDEGLFDREQQRRAYEREREKLRREGPEFGLQRAYFRQRERLRREGLGVGESPLWKQASAWLRTTKFQQSFTSGWSGSLKLPVGLEGSVNRAVTLAQNQLSLPEISNFFTNFLETVSTRYQVLIGIDELDKLASDDLARQFINDIK